MGVIKLRLCPLSIGGGGLSNFLQFRQEKAGRKAETPDSTKNPCLSVKKCQVNTGRIPHVSPAPPELRYHVQIIRYSNLDLEYHFCSEKARNISWLPIDLRHAIR